MSTIIIRCNLNSHCGANFKKKTREPSLSSDIKKLAEHIFFKTAQRVFSFTVLLKACTLKISFKRKQAVSVSFCFLLFSSVFFCFLLFPSVSFRFLPFPSVSFCFLLSPSVSFEAYQRSTRSVSGMNILLSGLMLKASYHALMCGKAPSTRHWPSEWGSLFVRLRISFSVMLPAHTPE